jgi:hypothetical protein
MLFHFLVAQYLHVMVVVAFTARHLQLRLTMSFPAAVVVGTIGKMLFQLATSAIT